MGSRIITSGKEVYSAASLEAAANVQTKPVFCFGALAVWYLLKSETNAGLAAAIGELSNNEAAGFLNADPGIGAAQLGSAHSRLDEGGLTVQVAGKSDVAGIAQRFSRLNITNNATALVNFSVTAYVVWGGGIAIHEPNRFAAEIVV